MSKKVEVAIESANVYKEGAKVIIDAAPLDMKSGAPVSITEDTPVKKGLAIIVETPSTDGK